jgi:hypothetical protein
MTNRKKRPTNAANNGGAKKQRGNYSTNSENQRARILEWLHREPLTTLQARAHLDIMLPAARILELKAQGFNIVTEWTTEDTGKAKHRVGRYVLLMAVES